MPSDYNFFVFVLLLGVSLVKKNMIVLKMNKKIIR
jgi:hypothetical protein